MPVSLIKRYGFSGLLTVEAREDGLLLKPKNRSKLSWEDTYKQMAESGEDWSGWEALADGPTEAWDGPSEEQFLDRGQRNSSRKAGRKNHAE